MAYNKKTWLARLGQGLNKFIFNGGSKVTLDSAPDVVSQQGTPLSADNMNDLEQRIKSGFDDVDSAINAITTLKSTTVRNQTYMVSSAYLNRVGAVVYMSYESDLQNVPIGEFTMQGLIPYGYRPTRTAIFGERNQGIITIRVQAGGDVVCYNYSGQTQSAMNGQFSACWITTDPLPS